MTETAFADMTAPQGVLFRSHRRRELSDRVLVTGVYAMAILGLLLGLVLFFRVLSEDFAARDRINLAHGAQSAALRADRLIATADGLIARLAPDIERASAKGVTADELRIIRRSIFGTIDATPVRGLAAYDGNGRVVLEIGAAGSALASSAFAQPLAGDADLLDDRLRVIATRGANAVLLHRALSGEGAVRLLVVFDHSVLADAISPTGDTASHVAAALLVDGGGNTVIELSMGASRIAAPGMSQAATPLDEVLLGVVAAGDGAASANTASAMLESDALRVFYVGAPFDLLRAVRESGRFVAALLGPGALCLLLIVSLIQNEWRKRDRRANIAADVVARAEIASDLLDAGIIDWSVDTASVAYSKGWRDMLGYDDAVAEEEIFDWIDRLHPEDRPAARTAYQSLLDTETATLEHDVRVRSSNGDFVRVHERGAVRVGPDGRAARIILVQTQTRTPAQTLASTTNAADPA